MSRLDGALDESMRRFALRLAVAVLATSALSCSGEGRRDANEELAGRRLGRTLWEFYRALTSAIAIVRCKQGKFTRARR